MTAFYVVNNKSPTAVFSLEFLFHPPPGFSVDLDRIDVTTPDYNDDDPEIPDLAYYAGILVTQHDPHRVWKLTGEATPTGHLFGRWPD